MTTAAVQVKQPIQDASDIVDRKKTRYIQLNTFEEESDQVNLYSVVVDASYPYQANGKFITTLKVIDPSCHTKGDEATARFKHSLVIVYAKRLEDCPVVRKVGDIMRVHRANTREHKGTRQFHVNVNFNASWVLWPSCQTETGKMDEGSDAEMSDGAIVKSFKKSTPYKFSGKNYSFDHSNDKATLNGIRQWSQDYFAENSVVNRSNYTKLREIKAMEDPKKEFDLLVKVIKVFEKDEHTLELRIKDISNEMWFMTVAKLKFAAHQIRQGDIVRFRSVMRSHTSERNVIECKNITNILKFQSTAKIVQELKQTILNETDADKILLGDPSEIIMSPVVYTKLSDEPSDGGDPYHKLPFFKIHDLITDFDSLPDEVKERNAFKVRFYILRIEPDNNWREVVQMMCPECKNTTSCEKLGVKNIAKCNDCEGNPECKPIYMIQMLVKDSASQLNKNFYRIMLYSYSANKGESFFGDDLLPTNLYRDEEKFKRISHHLNALLRFNIWVEAILERVNSFFVIKDTQIKSEITSDEE